MDPSASESANPMGAQVAIPRSWLDRSLDPDEIRQAQPAGTTMTVDGDIVTLAGVEVFLKRQWFGEAFWGLIRAAITQGYVDQMSPEGVILRADRRSGRARRTPALLARVRERSEQPVPG